MAWPNAWPFLYFYDEPTTGLDPVSSAHIHDLIYSIHNAPAEKGTDKTSIIITHDKDLLTRLRPRVVMLYQGRVHFDGSFEQFASTDTDVIRRFAPISNSCRSCTIVKWKMFRWRRI